MVFHTSKRNVIYPNLIVNNSKVERVTQFNFVGAMLHSHMTWNKHIIYYIYYYYREHIVPGYNEHVKEFHAIARHGFVMWRSAGEPRFGEICLSMNEV